MWSILWFKKKKKHLRLPLPHFDKIRGLIILPVRTWHPENITSIPNPQVPTSPLGPHTFGHVEICDPTGCKVLRKRKSPSLHHRPHRRRQLVFSVRRPQPGPTSVGRNCHPLKVLPHKALAPGLLPVPRSLFLTICNPFKGNWQEMAARKAPARATVGPSPLAHAQPQKIGPSQDSEHLWQSWEQLGIWQGLRGSGQMLAKFGKKHTLYWVFKLALKKPHLKNQNKPKTLTREKKTLYEN